MRKRRWFHIILLFAGIFLAVTIYVALLKNKVKEEVSNAPVIGLVVTVTEDDWQEDVFSSIIEYTQRSGYEIMTIQAERSKEAQIEAIRALIVYRVDTIVLLPVVDSGWDAVLIEAQEANIPVITADKGVRKSDKFAVNYVGYNYYADAVKAAEIMAGQVQSGDTIIEICGTLGAYPSKDITRGFRETLSQKGLKIQSSVSGDYMCSRGKEITEGFLKSSDSVDCLIVHNDAMTIGAVEAIKEQGKIPGKDVKIFAVGGGQATISLLQDGEINCLISRSPRCLGEEVVKAVEQLMHGEAIANNAVLIESETLIQEE